MTYTHCSVLGMGLSNPLRFESLNLHWYVYIEYTGIQSVFGEVTEAELVRAFDSDCKKFLGTYHSLPKILKALDKSFSKKAKDFQLLVDEAHMLTEGDDKDFMHNEINFILQSYTEIKTIYNNDLPPNAVIDKQVTGCGGTTLALTNLEPTIVAI